MVDKKQRLESLKAFRPHTVASFIDEEEMVEYELVFHPSISMFKVHRSDAPGIQNLPLMAISYLDFVQKFKSLNLNPANVFDRIMLRLREDWKQAPQERREDFFDSVPLNSLFLGEGL